MILNDIPRVSQLLGRPQPILAFTVYAKCLAMARGDAMQAEILAASKYGHMPIVADTFKSAMAAGSRASSWGTTLFSQPIAGEFVAAVRAREVLGRLANARRVPKNITIPRATADVSVGWIAESSPTAVTEAAFDSLTIGDAKLGSIIVISNELSRATGQSAEAMLQQLLIESCVAYSDRALLDPSIVAVTGKNPASLSSGVTAIASSGVTAINIASDLRLAISALATANSGVITSPIWIMSPKVKMSLSLIRDTAGAPAFPEVNNNILAGAPILTSSSAYGSTSGGQAIYLLDQNELFVHDDAELDIAVSGEASLQMLDTPSSSAANQVSLYANNLVAIKVLRWLTWQPRRSAGSTLQWIDGLAL